MQMSSGTDRDVSMTASVACHNADISQDTLRWTEDPNVMLCGITTSIHVASDQPNHRFAVCFLLPGLYKMYCYDANLHPKQALLALHHSVRPAYFLVA